MGLGTNDGTLYVKLYKTVLLGFILEITSSVTGRYAIYFKQILIYLFFYARWLYSHRSFTKDYFC